MPTRFNQINLLLVLTTLLVSTMRTYAQVDNEQKAYITEEQMEHKMQLGQLDRLHTQMAKMQVANRWDEAVESAVSYYQLATKMGEDTTYEYTEVVSVLAREHRRKGEAGEALRLMKQVVDMRRKLPDVRPGNLSVSISTLAQIHQDMNHIDSAIVLQEEALDIDTRSYKEGAKYIALDKVNLAAMLYTRQGAGELQRAIELVESALDDLPSKGIARASAMNALVLYHSSAGNNDKAAKLAPKAMKAGIKAYGNNSINYAKTLALHSLRLANTENFTSAIEYATESRRIFEENNTISQDYANLLKNLASYLNRVERYDEAIDTYQCAIETFGRMEGNNQLEIVNIKGEMAAVYNRKGDNEKAEGMMKELEAGSGQLNQSSAHYARMLRTMASTQASIGNYTAALEYEQQAIDIFASNDMSAEVAICANAMASYHNALGNSDKAMEAIDHAIDLFNQAGQMTWANHAQALSTKSILLHNMGQTSKALDVSREASAIYEQRQDTTNSYYARILANQAVYQYTLGNTDEAIQQILQSLAIQEQVLGQDHADNVMSVFNLAVFYKKKGEQALMDSTYHRALNMQMNYVRRNFTHLTSRERELYWNKKSYVLRAAPDFAYTSRNNADLMNDTYNTMLFTKGLLLNSEIDFRNLLSSTGNDKLKKRFEELVALNRSIDDAGRPGSNVSNSELQQMRRNADRLERDLVAGCKEFGDFTQNMSITTDDIRKSMGADDVAVEFMKVNLEDGDRGYAALVLRPDWQAPVMVHLFTQHQLDSDFTYNDMPLSQAVKAKNGINQAFNDPELGAQVWEPLASLWGDDVKNVYFSPDGMMYQWGIEYLVCGERGRMCDVYNMHRVSSTKTLCQAPSSDQINGAAIFGGMDYELTADDLVNDHNNINKGGYAVFYAMANEDDVRDLDFSNSEALDSLMTRAFDAKFLKGAYDEGEIINKLMMTHGIESDWYAYDGLSGIGSEEQFKRLSGQKRSIIHVATHGFYFTQSDMKKHFASMTSISDEDNAHDNSMNCSGLLMAGAKYALNGGKLPAGIENGILTAREISLLDLRDLHLVVLSACNTGMGEVKDEGVFGLQRGFKKAGAETLLMSLWSVNDAATQKMMTSFYNSLFNGNDRHQAMRDAREAVIGAGFDEPYYWCSFIMLD